MSFISLIKKFAAYDYWMGKSLILLSDNYVAKEDLFQAKVTLKSIIDNSKHADLVATAKDKLKIIEEQEAAKKIAPQTEELDINLGDDLDVDKLFAEPEKAVEETLPTPLEPEQKEEE